MPGRVATHRGQLKHLYQHAGKEAPKDQEYVQLDIYGRGNNAYRWAGETDVFGAMDNFLEAEAEAGREDSIDLRRVVLKGFSMGRVWRGASHWLLAVCLFGARCAACGILRS